jgi:glycosyltransferase involved in cell wall biosynthesis
LNIIYISKYASYAPYGIETRQLYIAKHLVTLGHEVKVYISDANHHLSAIPTTYTDTQHGVEIAWIKTLKYQKAYGIKRILSWFNFEWKLRKRLKKTTINPDVVIVSSLSLLSILNGIWLKKKYACKLVFEVRDIWPLVLKRISSISKYNPFYMLLAYIEKKGYHNSDVIIGTMPNLKEHVATVLNEQKSVIWMPHLINPSVIHADAHIYSNEIKGIRAKGYSHIIGYAGSINRSSSIELLLQGAAKLKEKNIAIVLLGNGPLLAELKEKYTLANVIFFNKTPQNQVVAFLKDCDFLYDGYLKSEVYKFGNSRNKYVEYCLAAKPLLVSYEGFDFFIEQYKCGVVVKPESVNDLVKGVEWLVQKDAQVLKEMGENAFNFAEDNLQICNQVNKLLSALNNV